MTEQLKLKLNDSKATRWGALVIVAFTMMAAYYVNDVVAPLKTMLETDLAWSSTDFGFFTGGYSFLNVFFLMLIWGGLILDRFGIRFTGKLATILMVGGTALEYYAMTGLAGADATLFGINEIFGYKTGVFVAFAGYSIFGVGAEVAGITVSKIIAKWFKGKELATAMGVQVALARIGSQAGYAVAIPLARAFGISTPVLLGLVLLLGGMIAFFIFAVMDKKLDKQMEAAAIAAGTEDEEEKFSFKDVKNILVNPGFWLIALLCVLFYSCVFPFQKFASELMIIKYGINENVAGTFAGLPAFYHAAGLGHADMCAFHLCYSRYKLLAGSYCADDNFGYRFLAGTFCHVAGCGQDIPGKPVGYGIRIDFLYPEYRSLGYSYIDRVGA